MTLAELNIAIAERCGWKLCPVCHAAGSPEHYSPPSGLACERLPDYCADLNACADAEARLTDAEHANFRDLLWTTISQPAKVREYHSASALQRSIALGLTWSLLTQEQADELREGK